MVSAKRAEGDALTPATPACPQSDSPSGAPSQVIYTCPMHPQIRQNGPRPVPDLRHGARTALADAMEDDSEIRSVRQEGSGFRPLLSIPVVLIAMLPHLLDRASVSAASARTLRLCRVRR